MITLNMRVENQITAVVMVSGQNTTALKTGFGKSATERQPTSNTAQSVGSLRRTTPATTLARSRGTPAANLKPSPP